MATTAAVNIQNACKSYGKREVLINLSMTVPKSSIYGLLGASGCGKTTLLSCVVGRRNLNSGDIWVLGGKPGSPGSGVPGPRVGYMPQDIALVGEFTVKDAIYYFGRIFDMPEKQIAKRFIELSTLLDLPPENRYIRNCSGGQQRRVSFAASMVHLPELLILDEPTAGVDPILRERIWNYLVEITNKTNMAVIITTHYIEEARQANVIGLMRQGCLLAEESPTNLLRMFETDVLEEVFLILSQKQQDGRLKKVPPNNTPLSIGSSDANISVASIDTTRGSTDVLAPTEKKKKIPTTTAVSLNGKRVRALLDKNWKQFYRNVSGLFFVLLFPIAQTGLFLISTGNDPRDLKLGIINEESMDVFCSNFKPTNTAMPFGYNSCHLRNISCRFLTYVNDPMIDKIKYDSLSEALEDIEHDKIVGAMFLADNITESFEERFEEGRNVDMAVLSASEIKVWLDMSNRQIGATLKYKLLTLFKDFQKDLIKDCNYSEKMADFMKINMFYGDENSSFTEYFTPGLILTVMFFLMAIMTSQIIITDRSEGVWDRSVIAGVSSLEICLTHFIIQLGIVFVYTCITLFITFVVYNIKSVGNLWIIALLTFLQGIDGMGYGFWISVVSYNITMANILATGSFYIMILICGMVWPIESMPIFLQWIAKCLPFTIPMESFRNVLKKGWHLENPQVYGGIGIEVTWMIIFAVVNTMLVQSKK